MIDDGLQTCRQRLKPAPRWIPFWHRHRWRFDWPDWLDAFPNDQLRLFFENFKHLQNHGTVVWGSLIQANAQLFQPGPFDHPAEFVYSFSNGMTHERLDAIAKKISELKRNPVGDVDCDAIGDYLRNEIERKFGHPVPRSICRNEDCMITTVYVIRRHLPPPQIIKRGSIPLLVYPQSPQIAQVLPFAYWPAAMVEAMKTA